MSREPAPWGVRLGAIGLLLVVFAAGAVSGAVFYRWARFDGGGDPRAMPPGPLGQMLRELELTNEQHAKVKDVFERFRPKLDAIVRESFPKVRAVQDEVDAEIDKLLTSEQRRKFTELRKRRPPPEAIMGPRGFGPHGARGGNSDMGPDDRVPPPPPYEPGPAAQPSITPSLPSANP